MSKFDVQDMAGMLVNFSAKGLPKQKNLQNAVYRIVFFYRSVPLKEDGLTFSLCCAITAHCISINTIAISLLCIWMGALFWSAAPLLGWGSFTGLSPHGHLPPH
jgi:hypothetical protein